MRLGLGLGIVKSAASIYKGILDKFPNAVAAYSTRKLKTSYPTTLPADYGGGAAAAYSLRKVKSDYEGSAVKVRRSSDGELQDIGFDSNGNLDTTALLAFVNEDVEKIVNGDFATDSNWTKGTGWTISGGAANCDGTQTSSSEFKTAVGIAIQGVEVTFSFEVKNYSAGTLNATIEGTGALEFSGINANGVYSTTATSSDSLPRVTFTASSDFVGSIDDVSVIQTTADGHVTRWYSQSDPVDTYTADFSGGVDGFVGNGDNELTGGLSITDEYGTTIDNVLELNCKNTNDTEHPIRKNNPFGVSNPINGKTLKCSFKMLVPSGQTGLVSAALSDGNLTTGGILSDGKVTEQGRWTTFTDVAWTQTALQSRLIFMGLDSSDDPEFVATAGEKFYIADVVLTETTDAYNATSTDQPLVVSGGSVITENGKAALDFDGVDDQFSVSVGITTGFAVFGVYKNTKANSYIIGNNPELGRRSNDEYRFRESIGFSAGANGGTHTNNQVLIAGLEDGANARVYANGVEQASVSSTFTSATIEIISKNYVDGTMQELIVFNSNQSTNRKDIEWNINNHYSIYDQWDRESCMNVRRSSDNATQDIGFSGKNINQTQLESFVNDASPVLDDYTGDDAAAAAYSLRKVRSAYTGSAIKVRRSSDDALQDIGFDANGDLDTTALQSFVNEDVDTYTSDFSSTEDLNESNGTGAAAQSVGGVDDAYKFTLSGGSATHFPEKVSLFQTNALSYSISFDYYIPSGNASCDGIKLNFITGAPNLTTQNSWTSVELTDVQSSTSGLRFYASDGGSISVNGDGDVFYLKNIVITQTTADGHVTTWYDQAGINNATADCSNPSACEQPLIVEAGDVLLENNKPAIKFDGVDDSFGFTALALDDMFISSVQKIDATTSGIYNGSSDYLRRRSSNYRSRIDFVTQDFLSGTFGQQTLVSFERSGSSLEFYEDGTSLGTATTSATFDIDEIGGGQVAFPFDGTIQELIFFDSDQSTNRLSIEGNIGRYYNITGYRDGFVTKWYDQSGEYNHAENSTHDEQPQIVSNGSMLKENGKAAIDFNGSVVNKKLTFTYAASTPISSFIVMHERGTNDFPYVLGASNGSSNDILCLGFIKSSNSVRNFIGGTNSFIDANYTDYSLYTSIMDAANSVLGRNGGSGAITNNATGTSNLTTFAIGSIPANVLSGSVDGTMQEIILFDSNQSGNRTDIEKNINTHFKIYS